MVSEQDPRIRTTDDKQQVEERSLIGSGYSFDDVGKISSQTAAQFDADDDD